MIVIDLNDRTTANLHELLENAKMSGLPQDEKDELVKKIEEKLGIGSDHTDVYKNIKDGSADTDDILS